MKSTRVIYILFFFLSFYGYSITEYNINSNWNRESIDSLYANQIRAGQEIINARILVEEYERLIEKDVRLANEDYKRLAENYALLDDAENSSAYLEKYIKNSFDTNVLYSEKFLNVKTSSSFQTLIGTYLPKMNGWIIFFIFSGVIGIFVSITINLRKRGDKIANLLIGLFVLLHSLFILHLCLYLTNYVYHFPHSFWSTVMFSFLYGPLLYFYFKRITSQYNFRYKDLWHLIPTIVLLVYFVPVYFLPEGVKQFKLFNVDSSYLSTLYIVLILKSISLIVYSIMVFVIYRRHVKLNKRITKEINLWQRNISSLNIFYALAYSVYAFVIASNVVFDRSKSFMLYSQVFVLASIVLYVAYTAYVQPRVFSKKYLFEKAQLKYKKSGLTEGFSIDLKEQLLVLLNDDKIYKTNNLSLERLSEILGTTRHNISQVINEHFNMNFFNLINKYRIEEAKRIFEEDFHNNLNIIDVAYDVGFNNKVTFNKAFKEETQLTPSQFLKQIQHTSLGVNLR